MTTEAFSRNVSPIAQAMAKVFELASAGQMEGKFRCPKCGSSVRYTATEPHRSSGHCNAACGVRWSN